MATPTWAAESVAKNVCAVHGHNMVRYESYDSLICSKCVLSIEEINDGKIGAGEEESDGE